MKWTHKLPAQAGWWWSLFRPHGKSREVAVVIIHITRNSHKKLRVGNQSLESFCNYSNQYGERLWAGPLEPPYPSEVEDQNFCYRGRVDPVNRTCPGKQAWHEEGSNGEVDGLLRSPASGSLDKRPRTASGDRATHDAAVNCAMGTAMASASVKEFALDGETGRAVHHAFPVHFRSRARGGPRS